MILSPREVMRMTVVLISQTCEQCDMVVSISIQVPPDVAKELNEPQEIVRELICFNCGELMDIHVCETVSSVLAYRTFKTRGMARTTEYTTS
jgi:hypothetical protein